jgi:predicted nucleotidyltransferase
MLGPHIIATVNQKVLAFLSKFSDKEFYERQVARRLDIAYGSANRALNDLYLTGAIRRRRDGKMYFYSIDNSSATLVEFKKLVNLALVEPLVEDLKTVASRIVLFGSCAQGADTSDSDLDLFVVSNEIEKATGMITSFSFPRGFEDIHIQPVIKSPAELLEAGESEQAFLEEVEQGIILWEKAAY